MQSMGANVSEGLAMEGSGGKRRESGRPCGLEEEREKWELRGTVSRNPDIFNLN